MVSQNNHGKVDEIFRFAYRVVLFLRHILVFSSGEKNILLVRAINAALQAFYKLLIFAGCVDYVQRMFNSPSTEYDRFCCVSLHFPQKMDEMVVIMSKKGIEIVLTKHDTGNTPHSLVTPDHHPGRGGSRLITSKDHRVL